MASARKIAQQAGVSIGTVSRVLNNKGGVGGATRQRVLGIAQELNYAPSKRLPLQLGNVTHIGLLVRPMPSDLMINPFYAEVYHGVEQICRDLRINLTIGTLDTDGDRLRSLPTLVDDERMGGLILVGAMSAELVETLTDTAALPAVLVDNWFAETSWDALMMDNTGGMRVATEHLLHLGHEAIAFVIGPQHPSIVERRQGYEESMQRAGLATRMVCTAGLEIEDGVTAAGQVMQRWPEVTAIICCNDMVAIGALRQLKQLGLCAPDDISLVGFDNISLTSVTTPSIATVSVDRNAFGRLAVDLLLSRVHTPSRPPVRCTMGVTFVERASIAPPRTHRLTTKEGWRAAASERQNEK